MGHVLGKRDMSCPRWDKLVNSRAKTLTQAPLHTQPSLFSPHPKQGQLWNHGLLTPVQGAFHCFPWNTAKTLGHSNQEDTVKVMVVDGRVRFIYFLFFELWETTTYDSGRGNNFPKHKDQGSKMWKRKRKEIQAVPEFTRVQVPKAPRTGNLIIIESLASSSLGTVKFEKF